jgi:hypothetical protein
MNDFVYEVLTYIGRAVKDIGLGTTPTLTFGNLNDIDVRKQTIFPLVHVNIGNATLTGTGVNVMQLDVELVVMDLVDIDKDLDLRVPSYDYAENFFWAQNANAVDCLNSTLYIANRIVGSFDRGKPFVNQCQLVGDVSFQPFVESFENNLAGWSTTITLQMPNVNVTVCRNAN